MEWAGVGAFIDSCMTNTMCGFLCSGATTNAREARGRQVKQNEIRPRLSTSKIPSGTQPSSHDTKLAFMVRSNYREKKLTMLGGSATVPAMDAAHRLSPSRCHVPYRHVHARGRATPPLTWAL